MAMIQVQNLVKKFGNITAVDNISFDVEEGTIFGFLGPNGAGKTTTISILCTLLSPTSGRTFINGFDCNQESSKVRSAIGSVFQVSSRDKEVTAAQKCLM